MKKLFKKLGICLLSMVLFVGVGVSLAACKKSENKETQVMVLSVNPEVEFIVDNNDKVISVTAANEDGAYILEKFTTFIGISAKDAALKFLELSEKYGFVVSGSTDGETFTISVSGDGAEKLYSDVKGKIQSKANELGLAINNMVDITKENLQNIVAECYQEYSSIEISKFSEEELINLIKQSREETKDLYTQDERLAYYKERAEEVIETKIEAIKNYLAQNASAIEQTLVSPFVNTMESVYSQIEQAYDEINSQLETLNNSIETELSSYISKKEAYLAAVEEYRAGLVLNSDSDLTNDVNLEELKAEYERLKGEAQTLWSSLEADRNTAKTQLLNYVNTTIHTQLTSLNTQINLILEQINLNMETIQTKINAEINDLKNEFVANSENPWNTND